MKTRVMNEEKLELKGGAYKSLKETAERLGFKSPESLAHFLIATIEKAGTRRITITNIDGKEQIFTPTSKVLIE